SRHRAAGSGTPWARPPSRPPAPTAPRSPPGAIGSSTGRSTARPSPSPDVDRRRARWDTRSRMRSGGRVIGATAALLALSAGPAAAIAGPRPGADTFFGTITSTTGRYAGDH